MEEGKQTARDQSLFIEFDGSMKKNNNEIWGATGVVIKTQGGETLFQESTLHTTISKSTEPEYLALKEALELTVTEFGTDVRLYVFGDDKGVLDVIQEDVNASATNESIQEVVEEIQNYLNEFPMTIISHVSREQNEDANYLANQTVKDYENGRLK